MDLQLLGPVEATVQGRPIPLGATKQRALLAMLALRANSSVSIDALIEGLWAGDPPATAAKMVQLYVSQLRRLLDGNGAEILTHGRGYELRLDADGIDAIRFERAVSDADAEALRAALRLWHGTPLADVAEEPFAAAEIRRLEELRLQATELTIDGDLAAGRHREVLSELETLVADYPLSERFHAQRMLALYRSGRQAEALEAYRHARHVLVDEIGVEPGPELRTLHDAVLRQDPSLDLPPAPPVASAPPAAPRARRSVRPLILGAAIALLAGVGIFAVTRLTAADSLPRIDENWVGLIDSKGNITHEYAVGRGPSADAAGAGSVWVANASDGTVSRIDREDHETATIPVGGDPAGLAFGAGSLWVANRRDRTVSQISPVTNRVVHTYTVGNAPRALTAAFGSVWVASEVDPAIVRIDLARGTVIKGAELGANPTALAAGAGALWAASEEGGTVFRIDPRSGAVVRPIDVGNGPVGIAIGAGAIWVANRQDATVSRIDPATDAVTDLVHVGRDPSAIAADDDSVWVANGGDGTVWRIDPASREVTEKVPIGSSPSALAIAGDSVWTAALPSPATHRGGTLRVEMGRLFCKCLDPGAYEAQPTASTYDGLVAYRRAGGSTFGPLVGDLATGVPEPSPDGRTYVFRLRPGLRYSNGEPVRAEDFRAALEAFLRRWGKSGIPDYYGRIRGAHACIAKPRTCDLSSGIETDAVARTITLRLTAPDHDMLYALALPFAYLVPADHPFHGADAPPGTGPYRIASFDPIRGMRAVRNPRFRVWSHDARPDGFPDQIVIRFLDRDRERERQLAAVRRGDSDVAEVVGPFGGPLPPARVRAIQAQSAAQLSTDADAELDYMWMNVETHPFDDPRVRRAINYAVDRKRMVALAGGADLADPACQMLPVSFPGYEPSCRYTEHPGPAGIWTGPDMATARRLIEASGTRGTRITVWGYEQKRPISSYFAALLRRLGYRTSLRIYPNYFEYYNAFATPRARAQIGLNGWTADTAAPSTFATPFVCVPNETKFCDRDLKARIEQARAAPGPEANARWKDVFRRLDNAAPIVPLVNHRTLTIVSKRVGNFQHHPFWGPLYDQLWVR